jgi:hypothetical protein
MQLRHYVLHYSSLPRNLVSTTVTALLLKEKWKQSFNDSGNYMHRFLKEVKSSACF